MKLARSFPRSAASLAVAASALVLTAALPASALAGPNPVTSSVAPDPSIVRGPDGSYNVYASSDDWADGAGTRTIPHFRSFDLVEWQYVGDALPGVPAWAAPGSALWAPDVHTNADGSLRMYYTTGGTAPCIGMATAPGTDGPWTDLGRPIVCTTPGSPLDPMDPFVDFSGERPVMYMGNFEGIHAVRMNAEGTALDGDPLEVAGPGSEAPQLVRHDGHTYLFLSKGLCCTGESSLYHVVVGRGDGPLGPFVDAEDVDLRDGGGDTVLQGNADWVGPGHPDVVTDDAGREWMLYHASPRGAATLPNGIQRRQLLIDAIDWSGGWPRVGADGTPSTVRPDDPTVSLPVRLDRTGEASLTGTVGATELAVPAVVRSTGEAYTGTIRATLTGPDKRPVPVLLRANGADRESVSVSVEPGQELATTYSVVLPAGLAAGQYELALSVGTDERPVDELAVYGLRIDEQGIPAPDPLGSLPLGSTGSGSGSLGS